MSKLFAVVTLVAIAHGAARAEGNGSSAVTTPTIEIVLAYHDPDFIDLSKKTVEHANLNGRPAKNLQSFVVAYKAWGQMGDFVATPAFYYELDRKSLEGRTRTVDFAQISKYPDLAQRYREIRPSSVNYRLFVDLWVSDVIGSPTVTFKVEDHQLVYFGSRSNQNYSSPGSPARWKYGVSMYGSGPDAFTDRDQSDEALLRAWFRKTYKATGSANSNIDLVIAWPGDEIDDIAKTYDEYEKKQKKIDDRAKQLEPDYVAPVAPPPRTGTDYDKPAPIPVKVELDRDLDNTTTKDGVVELSGKLTGPKRALESAKIIAEGYDQQFEVDSEGRFRNKVVLKAGRNTIKLQAGSKTIEQHITLDRKPSRLRATLTWNGSGDVDLHVTSPSGEHCSYQKRSVEGMTLDVDNTSSFGPENIFVQPALSGEYAIEVENFSRATGRTAWVYIYVDEKLDSKKSVTFSSDKERATIAKVKL